MFNLAERLPAWIPSWLEPLLSGTSANAVIEALLLIFGLAWWAIFRHAGGRWFARREEDMRRLAANEKRALWIAFLFPIVARLFLLWIYPPPQPWIHDEFSYLLIADTLLQGRLTNPPHPLWEHFETIHVFFDPTYSSKYPVGNGVLLALPQLFGMPSYVGVWLACGAMSAAIYWMLRLWLSPAWCLFGCLIVLPRQSVLSTWMHSYWGGAVAAIGGTLAIGALVRLMRKPEPKYAWIAGAGIAFLANTRPYEGFTLSIVLGVALLWWMRVSSYPLAFQLKTAVLPLVVCAAATIGFVAYHNYTVTGNALQLPYAHNRELYGTPQSFYWQDAVPAPYFRHRELKKNYDWQWSMHNNGTTLAGLVGAVQWKMKEFWLFFVGPALTVALLFLIPGVRGRPGMRLPVAATIAVIVAVNCYPFFYYHYFSPVTGAICLLLLIALQQLRQWKPPLGIGLSRVLMVVTLLSYGWQLGLDKLHAIGRNLNTPRTQVTEALEKLQGPHVVIVKYSPDHDFHKELVYNAADIDRSPIIWARDMGPRNRELLRYYQGRKFWIFEPDMKPPRLVPYEAQVLLPELQQLPR